MEPLAYRIQNLESRIFGVTSPNLSGISSIVPYLTDYAKDLGNAVEKRDRIEPLLRKVESLSTFLDPHFGEEFGVPISVKAELILSQESLIRATDGQLKRIHEIQSVLDQSRELESLTLSLEDKLNTLSQIQVKQDIEASEMSQETYDLLQSYNDIIESVSVSFIKFDEILKGLESTKKKGNHSQKD